MIFPTYPDSLLTLQAQPLAGIREGVIKQCIAEYPKTSHLC
jgi:hypothetical protein